MTTQPPIPTPMAAPAAERKDPVAITAPLREWAALLAVVAPLALLFFTLIVLLFDNAPFGGLGSTFSDRANATFGDFVSAVTIFLPLVGVLLATHVKPPVGKAKVITLLALIGYGVAALLGLVTMFAGFIRTVGLDLPGAVLHSFVTLFVRLIMLALLAFAGFVVLRIFLGAYSAPKPAPGGYPGYPGYPGGYPAQGYGQQQTAGYPQQTGYPQQPGYPQQQAYPTQQYQQQPTGYATTGYGQPAAPTSTPPAAPAQPSSAPPSGPYPNYSVSTPSSAPPAEPVSSAPPAPPTPPSASPWTAPSDRPAEEANDHTQAIPPRGRPGEEPTQRWG